MRRSIVVIAIVCACQAAGAQPARQTQQDEYTEYALLAPETASFRILYDVTSTTAGATTFFNPIRTLETLRKVYRFTVDVSDVVPVMAGPVRSWNIR